MPPGIKKKPHPPPSRITKETRGGGQGRAGTFNGRVLVTVTKQSSGDSGRMRGLRSQASFNKLDDLGEEGPSWRLSNGWIWGRHTIKDDTLVGGWEGEERGQNLGFCSLASSRPPFLSSIREVVWDRHPAAPLLLTGMPVRVTTFNSVSQDGRLRAERRGQWKFVEGGVCQRSRGISTHTICLNTQPASPSKCHLRVENSHCWPKT